MEPLQKHKHTVKGIEVLYIDNATLEKTKAGQTSFATMGPLNVIYLKKYDRFVLRLNDWMYPLIRRLPVVGPGRGEMNEPTYIMPAAHGSVYKLKTVGEPHPNLISNLECILTRNSRLVHKGEQMSTEQMEIMSPDDKVVRRMPGEDEPAEVAPRSMMCVMTGMMMAGPHKVKRTGDMRKDRKMGLVSRERKMNLKMIKNRDWRKEATSRIRNYVATTEKVSQEFMDLRKNNKNLTETKEYDMLKNINDQKLPVLYIHREEIEEVILNNKDLVSRGDYDLPQMMTMKMDEKPEETGGIVSRFWHGLTGYIFGKGTPNTNTSSTPTKGPMETQEKVPVVLDSKKGESQTCQGPIKEGVKVMVEEAMVKDPKKMEQMMSKDSKMMPADAVERPRDATKMDPMKTKDPKMMPKDRMTMDPTMMPRETMTMDPMMTRHSKMVPRDTMTMDPMMTRDPKMMPKDSTVMDPMMMPRDTTTMDPMMTRDPRDTMVMDPMMTRDPKMMPKESTVMDPTMMPRDPKMMPKDRITMDPMMTKDPKVMHKDAMMMDPMMTRDPKMMTKNPMMMSKDAMTMNPMMMDPTMTRDTMMMNPTMTRDTMTMDPTMMTRDPKMTPKDRITMDPMMTKDPKVMHKDAMMMDPMMTRDPKMMTKNPMMMPKDVMTMNPMMMDPTMTRDTMTMDPMMMPKDSKIMEPMMTRDPMMMMPGDAMTMDTTMSKGKVMMTNDPLMMMPTDAMTTETMMMAAEIMIERDMSKECATEDNMTESHMTTKGNHKSSRRNKKGSSSKMTSGKMHGEHHQG